MEMPDAKIFNANQFRLRIDRLETGATLRTGNLYAVFADDDRLASTLLWGTLVDACSSGRAACLIAAADVAKSIEESGLADAAQMAIAGASLAVFEVDRAGSDVRNKTRATQLIEDLGYLQLEGKPLLVIDDAQHLFQSFDAASLHTWRDWAESHGVAVLLLVRQAVTGDSAPIMALLPEAHLFAGLARLKSKYGVANWEIFHWFDPAGTLAGKTLRIRRNADARLEVTADEIPSSSALEPAADEACVLAMSTVFLPKEVVSDNWQIVDNIDLLAQKAVDAVAATIVLAFTPSTDFSRLARSVFSMRKQGGARLKIIIREVQSRLRYSQDSLMVRLGANLIVPAEISYSRFLSMTAMTQGQIFPYSLPGTYEQVLAETAPEQELGYLPAQEFCHLVSTTLERSRILQVQNLLLRLPMAYGLLPLDALRYCSIKRPGDLSSSDDKSVYLFLYACRDTNIDRVLERLFGLPISELFSKEIVFASAYDIQKEIRRLAERAANSPSPDLSAMLLNAMAAAMPKPATPQRTLDTKGPTALRYPAPAPAVRSPLATKREATVIDISTVHP